MNEVRKGSNGQDYEWTGDEWRPVGQQSLESVAGAAGTLLSSMALEPVAGLAGIAGAVLPGEQGQGAQWVENVRNQAYMPEDTNSLQALGGLLSPVMDAYSSGMDKAEGFATDQLGGAAGAAFRAAPEIGLTLLGAGPARAGASAAARVPGQALAVTARAADRVGDMAAPAARIGWEAADVAAGGRLTQMSDRIRRVAGGGGEPPVAGKAIMAADDGPDGRVLQGFLDQEEARMLNLPLTRGDELALAAQTQDELAHATRIRRAEELRTSDQWLGGMIRDVRAAQKDWGTNQVKQRLDLNGPANLTDDVLGRKLNSLGGEFDDWANRLGNTPLDETHWEALDSIAEHSTTESSSLVKQIVKDARQFTEQNNGMLSGKDWQTLRTRIGKMVEIGADQGVWPKVSDGNRLMDTLVDALESAAPTEARDAIRVTRTQYGLAKALLKRSGNLSPDGSVNSASLYNTLKKDRGIRGRSADSLLRMLETDRYLTTKLVPSSGTAERLLANPVRTGIVGGAGGLGLDQLLGE